MNTKILILVISLVIITYIFLKLYKSEHFQSTTSNLTSPASILNQETINFSGNNFEKAIVNLARIYQSVMNISEHDTEEKKIRALKNEIINSNLDNIKVLETNIKNDDYGNLINSLNFIVTQIQSELSNDETDVTINNKIKSILSNDFLKNIRNELSSCGIFIDTNEINTKNNIFIGFDKSSGNNEIEKLEKIKIFDINNSNLLIDGSNTDVILNNISIDKNYFNYENLLKIDQNKITFKKLKNDGSGEYKSVFYNNISQKNKEEEPSEFCIKTLDNEQCVNGSHFSMINGNNTIKLNNANTNEYVNPKILHSGIHPKTEIYYDISNPNTAPDCYEIGGNSPNNVYPSKPFFPFGLSQPRYYPNRQFTRFGLFHIQTQKYLCAAPWGWLYLVPHLLQWETFYVDGHAPVWIGRQWYFNRGGIRWKQSKDALYEFCNGYYDWRPFFRGHGVIPGRSSYLLGIKALSNHRYLYINRDWLGCKNWFFMNNRRTYLSTDAYMRFVKVDPNNTSDLTVYITDGYHKRCGSRNDTRFLGVLGGFLPTCVFRSPNEFCKWKIVPIYDNCSESCTKNSDCPSIDRPICRFYDEKSKTHGRCFKPEQISTFNQQPPHVCRFATKDASKKLGVDHMGNNSETLANETLFNEYIIEMAKSKKNKLYGDDTYSHEHSHGPDEHL